MNNDILSRALIQSDCLYLQAAGSTGNDGSVPGIHLRWDLMGELQNHIPRGTFEDSNKPSDTVKIYRSKYECRFPVTVDFSSQIPSEVVDSSNCLNLGESFENDERLWIYKFPNPDNAVVYVRFHDRVRYDAVTVNPLAAPLDFLRAYGDGLIEISVKDKPCFAARIYVDEPTDTPSLRVETIVSVKDNDDEKRILSSRQTVSDFTINHQVIVTDTILAQENNDDILQEDSSPIYLEQEEIEDITAPQDPSAYIVKRILLQETASELHLEDQGKILLERDNVEYFQDNIGYGYCTIKGEQIGSVRFTTEGCLLLKIELETYERYIKGVNARNRWEMLDIFGLPESTNKAYSRLEPNGMVIHGHWPKTIDTQVDIQYYKDSWTGIETNHEDGLCTIVNQYRSGITKQLSETNDSETNEPVTNDSEIPHEASTIDISYDVMLKIAAYDYHIARMLGLGHIDIPDEPDAEYVYLALYETSVGENNIAHLYATEPVSRNQEKLPHAPTQLPVDYGMWRNKGENNEIEITRQGGYTYDGTCRYVNLHIKDEFPYKEAGPFFEETDEFCLEGTTDSVLYGIERKKANEGNWEYLLKNNIDNINDEPMFCPSPNEGETRLYVHVQTKNDEGVNQYRIFGRNWFSRFSPYSNIVETDETLFVKQNKLIPPSNLHVQLIQKEDPLLLTTTAEQAMLADLGENNDKTLVRVQFNYEKAHDKQYQFGDQIEFLFRLEAPRSVTGKVAQVDYDEQHPETFIAHAADYSFLDIDGHKIVYSPDVKPKDFDRFIGGTCTIKNAIFIVDSFSNNGNGLLIHLKNNSSIASIDVGVADVAGEVQDVETQSSNNEAQKTWLIPTEYAEAPFVMIENMANAANWKMDELGAENVLGTTVQIANEDWEEHTETVTSDTSSVEECSRGIWDLATVSQYIVDNEAIPGMYSVEMNTKVLHEHPQQNSANPVFWDKGYLYIHTANDLNGERKQLDVVSIQSHGNGLIKLIVQDSDFDADSNSNTTRNIQTGSNISVQFYPGYRVYLYADNNADFNVANIIPKAGEGDKTTYMAARSKDSSMGYVSLLTKPTPLYAMELIEAIPPEVPMGGMYATRPDFYNKSTYTFRVKCHHRPYSIAFYRASERMILEALYKPETVQQIKADLKALGDDEFFTSRWQNLIDFDYDYSTEGGKYYDATGSNPDGTFRKFPAEDGYRFPKPDREKDIFGRDLFDGEKEPGVIKDKMREAIISCFLPLTEQPLIYEFISKYNNYVPTNSKQKVRDVHGDMLKPSDPDFCQAPMAKIVRDGDTPEIQFTDFTLDGAARNFYFYYAKELNNTMVISDASPITGPIQLVDTTPSEAPQIAGLKINVYDEYEETEPSVVITIQSDEAIEKYALYSTTDATKTLSIQTMRHVADFVNDGDEVELIDDFSAEGYVPFGEPLYYRVIGLRKITYADALGNPVTEYVPSKSSRVVMVTMVDTDNPTAPELRYTYDEDASSDSELNGVVLSWDKAVHGATYYVYKMNDAGNWELVETIISNDSEISYAIAEPLTIVDEDDNPLYPRYKVEVENASGLFSKNDNTIVIEKIIE
ncbi:MAG: hypothetical protein IK117_07365 [Bacteroidales bacterium]|nr:hypothetical protein [Bacteroidales bacterium]